MTPILVHRARHLPTIAAIALRTHLETSKQPLQLGKDLTASWPVFGRWRLDNGLQNLRDDVGAERVVEVELGRKGRGYLDPETKRVSMGFGLFLDAFILGRIPSSGSEIPSAYLAQSDLLDTPQLQSLVPELEVYQSGAQQALYRRTMWIGPSGSFTPFHRDPYHGIYTQILGRKTFHLLPPGAAGLLDLSTDPLQRNTSTVPLPVSRYYSQNLESGSESTEDYSNPPQASSLEPLAISQDIPPDLFQKEQRNLRRAFGLDGACMTELGPGESILIPEGWYHSAEGHDGPGVGVNAWFR